MITLNIRMCGLTGIISSNNKDYSKEIHCITEMLSHRGPDMTGYKIDKNRGLYFGHKRLSINDLSKKGIQPMQSKNKRYLIVFNGEIYNFNYLKKKYLSDFKFKSTTDTEVLLEGFSKYGSDFINFCDGMFAFAIYDFADQKTFLFRDRCGEKPLYFHLNQSRLVFSSELTSLIKINDFNKKIDEISLLQYLVFRYVNAPRSILENVKKVEPGTYVIIDKNNKIKVNRYFSYNIKSNIAFSDQEFPQKVSNLEQLIIKSIEERLLADVDVGCFLSGGTDSTLISLIASKVHKREINTYSFGIKNISESDYNVAQNTSKLIKSNHFSKIFNEDEVIDNIENINEIIDEPIGDRSILPSYLISREVIKSNKVILSGDGADELFAGYSRYPLLLNKENDKKYFNSINFAEKYYFYLINFLKNLNLESDLKLKNKFIDSTSQYTLLFQKNEHPSLVLKEFDFHTYLPGSILGKVDISSMKNSLEVRSPFLSKEIIEFSMNLPIEYCINSEFRKIILLSILNKFNITNKLLIGQKKTGFGLINFYKQSHIQEKISSFNKRKIRNLPFNIPIKNLINNNLNNINSNWSIFVLIKWIENNL